MIKKNYRLIGITVGMVLSMAILLIPLVQQTPHAFAAPSTAAATATAKSKGKGPAVGAIFSYTDPQSGAQDIAKVTDRSSGKYVIDVNMPSTSNSPQQYERLTFFDPYESPRGSSSSLFSIQLGSSAGNLTNVPITTVSQSTLTAEDQLDSGNNSAMKTTAKARTYWNREGYEIRFPYPATADSVAQWELQT